jgi:hypothetical protein
LIQNRKGGFFGVFKDILSPHRRRKGTKPSTKKCKIKEGALTQADMLREQLDRLQQKAAMLRGDCLIHFWFVINLFGQW